MIIPSGIFQNSPELISSRRSAVLQPVIACKRIGKPKLPSPETRDPLVIGANIEVARSGNSLSRIARTLLRYECFYLADNSIQGRGKLVRLWRRRLKQ